ncbi:MAG: extracellular solute-binding protein [Chitinispirillales bacterium]|jgi:spermidine/putrescine transport system substrate-binding protein|nr:extracellular solute-binding protein [Chitinispirillales bacterium]
MKRIAIITTVVAAAITISIALLLIIGCGPAKPKLYVYNWTYYIPNGVIKDFQKRYGVKVVYDMYASNEEMYAKLKAGGGKYDIVVPSGDHVAIMIAEGMLQEIDRSRVTGFANLDTSVLPWIKFDPGLKYSVPYAMGSAGVSISKKELGHVTTRSWKIFEDPALKGRFTLLDDMREVLGAALKSLGYSVNSTDTTELEEAKKVVLEWKKGVVKFDAEAFGKGFAAGEFWAVHGYAENVFSELDQDSQSDAEFFIPEEGGPMYMDNMVILKDAENVDLAYQFINYIHEPAVYAKIMDYFMLPSINVPARDYMKVKPHYQIEDLAKSEFKEDLGEHLELYNKIWQEIRVGK